MDFEYVTNLYRERERERERERRGWWCNPNPANSFVYSIMVSEWIVLRIVYVYIMLLSLELV